MARRRRVPRPPDPEQWELLFWDNSVEKDWDKLVAVAESAARRAHDQLSTNPLERTTRNHPLKGELAEYRKGKLVFPRWQHEVTGAGRIWFLIDQENRRIWLEKVTTGHPKKTER